MPSKITSPFTGKILNKKIQVKDYLISGETFDLYFDKDWDMLITQPQPDNLKKYYESENYQPHKKNKTNGFDGIYHFIRRYSFRYKYRLIKKWHPQAKTLLDYGTATGEFLTYMQQKSFEVYGVESNEKARKIANKQLNNRVYSQIDEVTGKFDVITLWHVLEHVRKPDELIKKLKHKLNPGGIVIIAVPNFKSYDAQLYGAYWAAYDVPRHLWHFSSRSICNLFEPYKMKVVGRKPLYFDSFYVSLLSEQYKTGKKRIIPAVINGLWSNLKASKNGEYSSLIYIIQS